jgi:hypothetical protein
LLLLTCLKAMSQQGFGYAVVGYVGPTTHYSKAVGTVPFEGSESGVYRGLLDSPVWSFDNLSARRTVSSARSISVTANLSFQGQTHGTPLFT